MTEPRKAPDLLPCIHGDGVGEFVAYQYYKRLGYKAPLYTCPMCGTTYQGDREPLDDDDSAAALVVVAA